ncbi:uncharacterized protein [Gossypium hirsutum]|uniref:Secreted protein n=1 Tax=Gossypium hirsutum TaxID=3635 RepID=A0ABM3B0A8_GOSHI|nr:uncharacterized protein LOC121223316 [Gossypium hirsutum]
MLSSLSLLMSLCSFLIPVEDQALQWSDLRIESLQKVKSFCIICPFEFVVFIPLIRYFISGGVLLQACPCPLALCFRGSDNVNPTVVTNVAVVDEATTCSAHAECGNTLIWP